MGDEHELKAIILAAGEGTRLRPYTLDRPKCLVEIDGKSLLDRQLAVLHSECVPVVVIGGYRAEMLKGRDFAVRLNAKYAETNMVWTLFCAEDDLEGERLLCYGDIVYSRNVLRAILASTADIAVAIDLDWEEYWRARNENPLDDAETLKLEVDLRIREIGQKPQSLADIEGQYMGLIKVRPAGIRTLKKVFHDAKAVGSLRGKPVEKAYMTDLLQAVIDLGYRVDAVPMRGGWAEVDTVGDLHSQITRNRLSQVESELSVAVLGPAARIHR